MAKRTLHPALVAHGLKVKAAHAHLSATVPGFKAKPMRAKMAHIQQHIRSLKPKPGGY